MSWSFAEIARQTWSASFCPELGDPTINSRRTSLASAAHIGGMAASPLNVRVQKGSPFFSRPVCELGAASMKPMLPALAFCIPLIGCNSPAYVGPVPLAADCSASLATDWSLAKREQSTATHAVVACNGRASTALAITMISPTAKERAGMAVAFRGCTFGLPTVDFSRSMPATIMAGLAYRRECSPAALPTKLRTIMRQPNFRLLDGVREFAPWTNAIEVATRFNEAFAGEHRRALALGTVRSATGIQLVCVEQVAGSDFFTVEPVPEDSEQISDCLADIAQPPLQGS